MTAATNKTLLERYETIWRISQQMLDFAKRQEWDRLIEIEAARASIIEELKQTDGMPWQAPESTKKAELIRAILACDDEIKSMTADRMSDLQRMLGGIGVERKLQKAYQLR